MAWTSPRTWVAGETVTAALMNTHVRDNLKAIGDAWTSYTPTLSQGASTNIAKTTVHAVYIAVGKLIIGNVYLSSTAAGTAGSDIKITLPVTAARTGMFVGAGWYLDTGAAHYPASAFIDTTTTLWLCRNDATLGNLRGIGFDPNIAVASGDQFYASFTYEAA